MRVTGLVTNLDAPFCHVGVRRAIIGVDVAGGEVAPRAETSVRRRSEPRQQAAFATTHLTARSTLQSTHMRVRTICSLAKRGKKVAMASNAQTCETER